MHTSQSENGLAEASLPGPHCHLTPEHPSPPMACRSGLAAKHFIDTGAGVVDEDYRGNVMVLLFNHSDVDFKGQSGMHAKTSDVMPCDVCQAM